MVCIPLYTSYSIYVCKASWEVTYICRLHCKSCKMFTFQVVNFISDYVYYLHSRLIFAEILFRVIYFYVNLRFCLFSCGFIFGNGLSKHFAWTDFRGLAVFKYIAWSNFRRLAQNPRKLVHTKIYLRKN